MKILIAYWAFPEPDTNAGSLRLFEIIKILLSQGHNITFLSQNENEGRYKTLLEELGIECLCNTGKEVRSFAVQFGKFLREQAFDVAILCHYFIYNTYAPYFRAFLPKCRLFLDTVDLHHLRLQREAALFSNPEIQEYAEQVHFKEVSAILDADSVWVVTPKERDIVASIVSTNDTAVHVVPNIHNVVRSLPDDSQRNGIVFLGCYRHPPNVDAVNYFMKEVFPPLKEMLPEGRVTIAGSNPPDDFRRYEKVYSNVFVTGYVEDHHALLTSSLVGIAPLRYGAGMKGKIGEYLACGLPCVSTSIGVEGMGLQNEHEILVADDPVQFAKAIVRLHDDVELWQSLSRAGLRYIQDHLTSDIVTYQVLHALQTTYVPGKQERERSIQQINLIKLELEQAKADKAELEKLKAELEKLKAELEKLKV